MVNLKIVDILKETKLELLYSLYKSWSGNNALSINKLPASGSKREYYRIAGAKNSVVGVINDIREENEAFIEFSKYFNSKGLAVPEILFTDLDNHAYLQQDLGDTTLFNYLMQVRDNDSFFDKLTQLYKRVLKELLRFQVLAAPELNYSVCYPRASFDRQSMQWDLSYFKYYFLKLADIPFNEQLLEDDFNILIDYLQSIETDYFMYRDFQSRNIMIKNEKLFFIDYQGGRKGALQYDVASLLYDAKADIPQSIRQELLDFYIDNLKSYKKVNTTEFKKGYYAYVLIRMMQAMGAFGFRGFYEKKSHFLQSIPYALKNLKWVLQNIDLPVELPHLMQVFESLLESKKLARYKIKKQGKSTLSVLINSFSYKKGLPNDSSGNGGGFVFDCRAIKNPGRYDEFKQLTGKDKPVIDFFNSETDIHEFLSNVYALVDMSVDNYEQRNFTNLMVSFGCTGGQHRSVYCAEKLAEYLRQNYSAQIKLWHREQH